MLVVDPLSAILQYVAPSKLFSHCVRSVTRTWKEALSFCLYTKIIFCVTAQEGIALPAALRERREATINTNFFTEMTSQVQCWPSFWGDCHVLIYCPDLREATLVWGGPAEAGSKSPLSVGKDLWLQRSMWQLSEPCGPG